MMKNLSWEHLRTACAAMYEREQNHGCWVGGEIPQIFEEIRDIYYPLLKDDPQWLFVIESVVEKNAVRVIGRPDYELKEPHE